MSSVTQENLNAFDAIDVAELSIDKKPAQESPLTTEFFATPSITS